MSNQKWEVGPVKLVGGGDAFIDAINEGQEDYRYTGRYWLGDKLVSQGWHSTGRAMYHTTDSPTNLAPPPKKTVRVKGWLNVYANGSASFWRYKDTADSQKHRFACFEIEREVEEGEGLS